ncbi:hypothetical protein Y032_0574g188 [Ancylostoma ceylanicum]|uniref:Uncharacterized protein n=1 Tax=Ancylostoma ceylanicum TaxID=53326 RepID=A0A016WNA3_9BILA|nr:hypothetical protein Y032_0574g188 [Ancylostoma ceylanicum]
MLVLLICAVCVVIDHFFFRLVLYCSLRSSYDELGRHSRVYIFHVYLSVCLPVCLSVCSSVCHSLSVCTCLSVCQFVCVVC